MNITLINILIILGIVYISFKLILFVIVTIAKIIEKILTRETKEEREWRTHFETLKKMQDSVSK